MSDSRQPRGRGSLREALATRVVVADGAMGTMLQAHDLGLDDFEGHEGCNEILNVTRPDVVRSVHDAYFDVGVDASRPTRSARTSRTSASTASPTASPSWPRPAPGSPARRPTPGPAPSARAGSSARSARARSCRRFGHAPYATLRDAYQAQVDGLLAGGADAILIETCQDLLQAKAAVVGAKRAMAAAGADLPMIVQVTVETTGHDARSAPRSAPH